MLDAQSFYNSGQYFKAARYAFTAQELDSSLQSESYSWITISLIQARLYNAASYFFIRTLQSGNKAAIRRVLTHSQELLVRLGADILRKYLIRHTNYEDYDGTNRSAYLYALSKDALLKGQHDKAIGYVNGMSSRSPLWPYALLVRGTARAILGQGNLAIADFKRCENNASDYADRLKANSSGKRFKQLLREADDLESRCIAGQARTLYQMERFDEADQTYDQIAKASYVWPDILFEQAWNSFARQEYNRSLGKLVSYKSPALKFVFNTEADVLNAQSYLALCLYPDANEAINDFNSKYGRFGENLKRFIQANSSNLFSMYSLGKESLRGPLHSSNTMNRLVNRFVRGPYFQNLVAAESAVYTEEYNIRQFDVNQAGVNHDPRSGFPGFLDQVLKWRLKTIRMLGGVFVKNSLLDYYQTIISDFDKMSFIKLEMLSRAKGRLLGRKVEERSRGNIIPSRRDYQYYWSFNGEFWTDELGDYVFGLESQCGT